jgi:hypothetical protein
MRVDWGLRVNFVHYGPPNQPVSPKTPRKPEPSGPQSKIRQPNGPGSFRH